MSIDIHQILPLLLLDAMVHDGGDTPAAAAAAGLQLLRHIYALDKCFPPAKQWEDRPSDDCPQHVPDDRLLQEDRKRPHYNGLTTQLVESRLIR